MTTTTTRYGLNKIVLASDNVDVVADFNTNWDAIDLKLGAQVCTFSTLPASPPQGMTAIATDNKSYWVNTGTSGSPAWLNTNPNSDWYNVVTRYGADPTGVAEASTAINNAIAAANAAGGGTVYIPPGVYKCTPTGSPAVAINMSGVQNVTLKGANWIASQLKKTGTGTLINMSGPSTDTTGVTHAKYCTIEDLFLNGNTNTGTLILCYYADNHTFHRMRVKDNYDICVDTAEFWDSRFYNCVFETSGSVVTANALMPNILMRNSAAASGFGFSTDNVDNIYFWGCRFEDFRNGAVRVMQGISNTNNASKIFMTDCKMESSFLFGGSHLQVDSTCQGIHVSHLYCFSGGFESGFSTAQDVITWSPQGSVIRDVFISNRASTASVANGITVNAFTTDITTTVKNVVGFYNTSPTGAHMNFGTVTGFVDYDGIECTNGAIYGGVTPKSRGKFPIITTTTIANTTTPTTLQQTTIPANDPNHGTTYNMKGFGSFGTTGTVNMTFAVLWNAIALPSLTFSNSAGLTGLTYEYEVLLNFQTATSVVTMFRLSWATSNSSFSTNTYTLVKTATTVVTNADSTFTVQFTWGTASASNTISALGGRTIKEIG